MTNYDAALSGGAILRLSVTESSQDIENNTSTDAWSLTLIKGSYSSFNLGGVNYSVGINGSTVDSGSYTFDFRSTSSKLIASGTTVVAHNADGTKTTAVTGHTDATATSSGGPATASGNFVQTTIPRATVPTLSNSSRQIGQSTTINLPRASSSFTHDITYAFGSLTGQTSGLSASTGVATSATFTVPQALVSEMVGQSSKTLTFKVVTKSGSTVIGSKTVQLTVTPAGGTVYQRPTVSAGVVRALSDGTPDDDGTCAKVSITAAVTSVLVSSEQNTLTWKTEVSADSGSSWKQLGTGTVSSHGLTLSSATTYTDSDPGTGGTQPFATTSGFLFRVTITDAYSNSAVQIVAMTTAAAILDVYSESGEPVGLGIGALYDPDGHGRIQIDGEPYEMRCSFATKTDLDAFTGWSGLVGFVESENSDYVSISGEWKLWNRVRSAFTPTWNSGWAAPGDADIDAFVTVSAGVAHFELDITFGSTSGAWTDPAVIVPAAFARLGAVIRSVPGQVYARDVSAAASRFGPVMASEFNAASAYLRLFQPSGSSVGFMSLATAFTPGVGDTVSARWSWPVG